MSDYLPDEVVLEILYKLPVKSLIRFKHCLDKPYVEHYKLIDDNNDSFHQIQNIELPLIVVSYLLPKSTSKLILVFNCTTPLTHLLLKPMHFLCIIEALNSLPINYPYSNYCCNHNPQQIS